ncbi:MAG TPA: MATE family efflux transporter [Pirellulales bacterium]|jgi:putative MATE family efflux protein|nr:MATE family efflux transporter [Pirellulales bacterium]
MNSRPAAAAADARLFSRLLRLALPSLAEQTLTLLVTWIDMMLTTRYLRDDSFLAAMNQVNYLLWLIPSLFAFVGIGATAVIARHIGANDTLGAQRVVHQALLVGAAIALVILLLFPLLGAHFFELLQLPPQTAELGWTFLRTVLPAVPFVMIEQIGNACLRGAGDTVTGLVAMTLVNLVDAVVGVSLLTGWGPFPKLGWQGIAIGTASGYAVGGILIGLALWRGRGGLKLQRRLWRPDFSAIRRILRIGVPGGIDIIALISCQLWFVSIINRLGDETAAAHGIAIRIEALAYLPGTALQIAATTLAGQYLGARDPHNARRSALVSLLWALLFMTGLGCAFYFAAAPLVRWFVGPEQDALVAAASPLIKTVAFGMPALALIQVFVGTLRGSGDTRIPLFVTFFGFLLVRIPLAYLLATPQGEPVLFGLATGWGIGVQGAWCAMVTDLWIRALPLTLRFFQGGWQKIRV